MRSTICALLSIASSMPGGVGQRRADPASAGACPECATDGAASSVARSWSALSDAGSGAPAFHHADRRVGKLPARIRLRTARFLEAGQRVPDHDHHVRVFAARQTELGIAVRRFSHRRARITTRWLPVCFSHAGASFPARRFEAAGDHHGDLSGQRLPPVAASSSVASRVPVVLRIIFSLINVAVCSATALRR